MSIPKASGSYRAWVFQFKDPSDTQGGGWMVGPDNDVALRKDPHSLDDHPCPEFYDSAHVAREHNWPLNGYPVLVDVVLALSTTAPKDVEEEERMQMGTVEVVSRAGPGGDVIKFRCPECGRINYLIDDQYHGELSTYCFTPKCAYDMKKIDWCRRTVVRETKGTDLGEGEALA